MCQAKAQISLDISPVWSVFAVHMKKQWDPSYPLSAQQRLWLWMPRLIWDFAGSTCHVAGFITWRLNWYFLNFDDTDEALWLLEQHKRKTLKNSDTWKKCCIHPKIRIVIVILLQSNGSKRCRQNDKQYRRWSESTLLNVWKPMIITVFGLHWLKYGPT